MKTNLANVPVLAMYDIRGIQNYIFRTNYVKEIIGASVIVENIIEEGLRESVVLEKLDDSLCVLNWENDNIEFLEDDSIQMQVLFIGGGNAYVLYRTGELCGRINRRLAKYILENTYSLQLAVAVVEKTDDYKEDYKRINEEMRLVKSQMPSGHPTGAFPFMKVDPMTGFPIVGKNIYDDDTKFVSYESRLKRKNITEGEEKILDNLVTEKGKNSNLALVHIDGNNMGRRLMGIMQDKDDYKSAVLTMRTVSRNINCCFNDAYESMKIHIKGLSNKPVRKIVLAGDDITFVCNALVAMEAVKVFLKSVTAQTMYNDSEDRISNLKKYGFSACAGIAYFNSHFPFSDAYKVAEACVSSAKKKAKDENCKDGDHIGSFVDYQICSTIMAADLDSYREKHYTHYDSGESMIARPYYVGSDAIASYSELNEKNERYDISHLEECLITFNKMPRSQAKTLRDRCARGENERAQYISFLESRQRLLPKNPQCWYDALEIMDLTMIKEDA